jgi:1,4-alpha-glucan branching enzyme
MISADDLDRLTLGDHANPHALLGPHLDGASTIVRAYRPDAKSVTLIPDDGAPIAMTRVHDAGLFEARVLRADAFKYRFEVAYEAGVFTLRDPYAFPVSLGELDLHLFGEGTHQRAHHYLGAHEREIDGQHGTSFVVWAPAARRVSVTGSFNDWDGRLHPMRRLSGGLWELFVPEIGHATLYKFEIRAENGSVFLKTDPYARAMELRPNTASKVYTSRYRFEDEAWMEQRTANDVKRGPVAIYEVHLGSWKQRAVDAAEKDPQKRFFTYRELADQLVDYVVGLGFTHVELLPITEHPYDGSWGYQTSGYFAPTSRYGEPDDFRYFVDRCHQRGLGVILDWTPAHFPKDSFALGRFDGTALYEHLDPRKGEHKHWGTFIFNYGRAEVKNFLLASALAWFEEFHVDGLRVDAVASMLYLDYSARNDFDWVPNRYGGRENLDAIAFLRELTDLVHARSPGAVIFAEESTAWPGVTRPTYVGGLGFDFKWNMGWMHDTLDYFKLDPIFRSFHHTKITFGLMYAFSERFLLPLSHDEVVHLKKAILQKMPGDRWQMHANVRALYAHMWAHPGKKLVFMGAELGQYGEWNFEAELDWYLTKEGDHAGVQRLFADLNAVYREHRALHELDDDPEGFVWIDANDSAQSVASYVRFARQEGGPTRRGFEKHDRKAEHVVVAGNFTPVPRYGYRLGVPRAARYREIINTDAVIYGGSGMGNLGVVAIEDVPSHGFEQSIVLTLPPLAVLWLVPELDAIVDATDASVASVPSVPSAAGEPHIDDADRSHSTE